jgi:biotin carboxyl carrier protein
MEVSSPVTGTVWKVEVNVGDKVREGDVLLILESMKMEIPVEATADGTVSDIAVEPGVAVDEGQTLCLIGS